MTNNSKTHKVLIADDEESNRRILETQLQLLGYETVLAVDGNDAIEKVASNSPDLILLDIMMPGMDGFEVCMILKADLKTAMIPVLFVTALDDKESRHRGLEVGGNDFLTKPVDKFELMLRVKNLLEIKDYQDFIVDYNRQLEKEVNKKTSEIQAAYDSLKVAHDKLIDNKLTLEKKNALLEEANRDLVDTRAQVVQSEKMASVGLLAAGVAHEINNPVGYVKSNLNSLKDYADDLRGLLKLHGSLMKVKEDGASDLKEILKAIEEYSENVSLEELVTDIDEIVAESIEGMDRVADIVKSLKDYSHQESGAVAKHSDINECLEDAIKLCWHEIKYKVKLIKELGELPRIVCRSQQLCQVFLNLIVNASHAVSDDGKIWVKSYPNENYVVVEIRDNGHGIPADKLGKIFDPFFTTKVQGEGTGLGLSIAYGIIEEHNGIIEVDSGEWGTCFTIHLPYEGMEADEAPCGQEDGG